MLLFSPDFKILNVHTVPKYLYLNWFRWLGGLVNIQSRSAEEKAWHLEKPPVGYVRSGFVCVIYFLDSAEIAKKFYCYSSIFDWIWMSTQPLLWTSLLEGKVVVCDKNNCNLKESERSFRICQGDPPAIWRAVVHLLLHGAVETIAKL